MSTYNGFPTIQPVIELALAQTSSRGAYVYQFSSEGDEATIVGFAGPAPESTSLRSGAAIRHSNRNTPIVLQQGASTDWRFADLPEFRAHKFEAVVSVPLVDSGAIVGMANFCRPDSGVITAGELGLLLELSLPLAALVAAPKLREELNKTVKRLEDRKVVERAKGIIQETMGVTEEQAYMHLRRLSRRNRTPMRDIAERLIQSTQLRLGAPA